MGQNDVGKVLEQRKRKLDAKAVISQLIFMNIHEYIHTSTCIFVPQCKRIYGHACICVFMSYVYIHLCDGEHGSDRRRCLDLTRHQACLHDVEGRGGH